MASKEDKILTHLNAAKVYSKLSNAKRLKVCAIIVQDDRPIVNGLNGMPPGGSNICETLEQQGSIAEWITKPEVSHAEANAIAWAAKKGTPTDGAIMICTHSPCFECAKLIKNAGIKEVYYETEYRLTNSIDFLKRYKIIIERINNV